MRSETAVGDEYNLVYVAESNTRLDLEIVRAELNRHKRLHQRENSRVMRAGQ
jgi:hypothetical protein